jgi:hypothetical protein
MLQAGFILLTIVMAVLLIRALSAAATISGLKTFVPRAAVILIFWFGYIAAISFTGILNTIEFPPRIPLLLVLPTFVFMAYFFTTARFKPLIAATSAGALTYMQSYRIVVELLLLLAFNQGIIPQAATFEGYNYEIAIAALALVVGYFGYTKRVLPETLIMLWNILGLITLAIIVFILLSHAYFPAHLQGSSLFSMKDFSSFPFTLLPGFLMPLAVFMHIFCIIKLRNKQMN